MPNIPATSSLRIQPKAGLDPLFLGASLYSTLNTLLQHKSTFPRLNILFNSTSPVSNPVYIDLEANGLRLRFDGESQHLELIEVTEFGKLGLLYGDINLRNITLILLLTIVAMERRHFGPFIRPLDLLHLENYCQPLRRLPQRISCHILESHSSFLFLRTFRHQRQIRSC